MLLVAQAVAKEWLFPRGGIQQLLLLVTPSIKVFYFNFFQLFTYNDLPSMCTASLIHPLCYLQRNHKDLH